MAKPLVPIVENKNILYSIEKRQSKRIRNNKHKDSNLNEKSGENGPPSRRRKIENSALKDLFNEQEINWNRKEFVKVCQSRSICLDDDDIANTTKLISWFD
ncbi:27491_t:CDS:2, partial [Dentiscutata erythropus]